MAAQPANGQKGSEKIEGILEGQKVYVPDAGVAWARATVLNALWGSKFEVNVSPPTDGGKMPHKTGSIVVDVKGRGFEGMNSLPLQNVASPDGTGVEDMCSLNHLHEPAILYNLRDRFRGLLPYTYTGEICIAINPYQWLGIYGEELGKRYKMAAKRSDLPPHVYATSAQAFKGLQTYGANQSILVSGESGAGKTETVKILLNHVASIAGAHANDRTIEKVITSNPLLESFGNAKTLRNDNSSRFGKFTELQLDDRCRLSGSKSNTYLLEKVRVVSHAVGERTYHVFYQLLAAPESQKKHYCLKGKRSTDFRYTNMGGNQDGIIEGMSDGQRFEQTAKALSVIGLQSKEVGELLSAISGVLHLGQIEFDESNSDSGVHGCVPRDNTMLSAPAKMLGVSAKELGHHLTHRNVQVEGKSIDVPLSPAAAVDSLDGLAKEVYTRVFDWLVDKINESTHCAKGTLAGTINLLDIFGFETFVHNSFEQLCINYANEKLQQKFTQDVFKNVQVEYKEENIPWSHIDFQDNAKVLFMIEEHRKGLLSLLDEECMLPQSSDEAYASKAHRAYKDHGNFSKSKLATNLEFTVHHYAGQVVYNTAGFVDKNRDQLQMDLAHTLAKSENGVLKNCFASKKQLVGPDGVPLSPPERNGRQRKGSLMQESLGSKFKRQLHALMAAIERTEVQYVRCIKPNANKSSEEYDYLMVVEQLRCAGVIEAIRISRAAYPNRMVFKEFAARFQPLAKQANLRKSRSSASEMSSYDRMNPRSKCSFILDVLLGRRKNSRCCLGNTKVYFRAGVLEQLEEERGNFVRDKLLTVQRVLIGNAKRRPYLRLRKATIIAQKNFRANQQRKRYLTQLRAVADIQRLFRGHRGRVVARRARAEREEKLRKEREEKEARSRAKRKAEEERKRMEAERRKEEEERLKAAAAAEKAKAGAEKSGGKKMFRNKLKKGKGNGASAAGAGAVAGDGGAGEDWGANGDSPGTNGAAVVGIVDDDEDDDELRPGQARRHASSATFSRFYSGHVGSSGGGREAADDDDSSKGVGRYNPLFHNATKTGGDKGEENFGLRVQRRNEGAPSGSPRTMRRTHFMEFNPKALEGFMRVDMRGFLTNPIPRKGGTVKCFIRREKKELVRGLSKLIRGQEVYKLYMEGKGDFPDRYLMTARKKAGPAASQFVITMGDSEDSEESNVVGRLKATSRTSEEFQIFSPVMSGSQDAQGVVRDKEVAAVHYSADKMDPHGRYDGPRKMRVVLGNVHGNSSSSTSDSEGSLLHRMLRGSLDSLEEPCLVNRNPRWNAKVQAFVLNFHGRVTQASVKNFQLVVQGDISEQITLQFGRTHTNEFTMDFCHPLSPLQALAITLTSFDCK